MPAAESDEIAAIGREIKQYLEAHPHAADSLDGIVGWWLPRQRYQESLERVQKALDDLTSQGVIDRRVGRDGQVVYGVAHKPGDNP